MVVDGHQRAEGCPPSDDGLVDTGEKGEDRYGCQQEWKADELAEHTVVLVQRLLIEMAATVVGNTFVAALFLLPALLMDMQRRQQQHWHEYCQ